MVKIKIRSNEFYEITYYVNEYMFSVISEVIIDFISIDYIFNFIMME
jgi:hypothetical protein